MFVLNESRSESLHMFLAGIGRDVGERKENQGEGRIFSVGNVFHYVDLTKEEYLFWKYSQTQSDIPTWMEEYVDQFNSTPQRFLELFTFLETNKLILDFTNFTGVNDPNLRCYQVSKNGQAITRDFDKNEWIWMNRRPQIQNEKEIVFYLTDELYLLWRCASGVTSMYDVIVNYQKTQKCTLEKAVNTFLSCVQKFHQLGLWTIDFIPDGLKEYVPCEEYAPTKNVSCFHWEHVRPDTSLMAIGEELGIIEIENPNAGFCIHMGKEFGTLTIEEYPVWQAVRMGCRNAKEIAKLYDLLIDEVMVVLKSIMDKKMIMIWPKGWNFSDDIFISFHPTGLVNGREEDRIYLQESKLGQKIPLEALSYSVWLSSNVLLPLSLVRDQLVNSFSCNQTTAAHIVCDMIPQLIKCGLGCVLFTPSLDDLQGEE